jgi:hypothetical protein
MDLSDSPAARPVPRGRPVGSRTHRLGPPVLQSISLCRHAVAYTPVGPQVRKSRSPGTCDGGLPRVPAGSAPTLPFSRPDRRSLTLRPACSRGRLAALSIEGFGRISLPCRSDCYRLERPLAGWDLHPLKIGALARRTGPFGSIRSIRSNCRVERWRGGLGQAQRFPALSAAGASLAWPCPVSTSRSSNRTCGFAASGSRTRTSRVRARGPVGSSLEPQQAQLLVQVMVRVA